MFAVSAFLPSAPFSQLIQTFSSSSLGAPACLPVDGLSGMPPRGLTSESSVASSMSGAPLHGFGFAACARPGATPDTARADNAAQVARRDGMDTYSPFGTIP